MSPSTTSLYLRVQCFFVTRATLVFLPLLADEMREVISSTKMKTKIDNENENEKWTLKRSPRSASAPACGVLPQVLPQVLPHASTNESIQAQITSVISGLFHEGDQMREVKKSVYIKEGRDRVNRPLPDDHPLESARTYELITSICIKILDAFYKRFKWILWTIRFER